jgi:hypothetical protein
MTKEEFKTKKEIINSKMNELKNEMIKLEKEYIESNAKYPIGSKVCITTPAYTAIRLSDLENVTAPERKQYAYVKGYRIADFLDTVEPLFSKVKKDGTMSEMNLYVSLTNATIELVKE